MKKLITLILITAIVSCKKKEVEPTPTTPICETHTKIFDGKYTSNTSSHDTITISYSKNNCPVESSNNYWVYGLGKALTAMGSSVVFDVTKTYNITSNEAAKSASTSGANCNWGIMADGKLSCNYQNVGAVVFTKIN